MKIAERAWLVELIMDDGRSEWWFETAVTHGWTAEALAAKRFDSREQAEKYISLRFNPDGPCRNAFASEHRWTLLWERL